MDSKDIAKEWFMMTDWDLASATFLLDMRPLPLGIIAYHCQQCVEKYLKGFLALQGGEIEKTHDLVMLNHRCKAFDSTFESIDEHCINLTDYGVQVRYPFHIDIEVHDVRKAIDDARMVKRFVSERCAKPTD